MRSSPSLPSSIKHITRVKKKICYRVRIILSSHIHITQQVITYLIILLHQNI